MSLEVQIQSIITSFVFGFLYAYLINLLYKFLFFGGIVKRAITNFMFNFITFMLYFLSMKLINQADIHIYFIFMAIIGYLIGNIFSKKIYINLHNNVNDKNT